MHTKRIIPCLDVKAGRVVKGTNFVGLQDAGDPRAHFHLARAERLRGVFERHRQGFLLHRDGGNGDGTAGHAAVPILRRLAAGGKEQAQQDGRGQAEIPGGRLNKGLATRHGVSPGRFALGEGVRLSNESWGFYIRTKMYVNPRQKI